MAVMPLAVRVGVVMRMGSMIVVVRGMVMVMVMVVVMRAVVVRAMVVDMPRLGLVPVIVRFVLVVVLSH
jgi:hypothetical protein